MPMEEIDLLDQVDKVDRGVKVPLFCQLLEHSTFLTAGRNSSVFST
jgi:hypothetical protein